MAALQGKKHAAKQEYEVAVVMASRGGFIGDAALAYERFFIHLLEISETEEALDKLDKAIELYSEWGAIRKATILQETYSYLFTKPKEILALKPAIDAWEQ